MLERFSYYSALGIMLVRGTLYQFFHFQFRGWILLGRGGRVHGLKNIKLHGIVKFGAYSLVDARFCDGVILGCNFSLGDFSIMRASGSIHFNSAGIEIENNVSFGPYSNIGGGYGLVVGDDCVFGPYVSIHPEGHVFENLHTPIRQQGIHGAGISIGKNNWFGAKCTILDGAEVDSGCVFGAQSLLVKGPYTDSRVYVGNPAKPISSRRRQ